MKRHFLPTLLSLFFFVAAVSADDVPAVKENLSEAEIREQKIVDRFRTLLEKNPRRGTSFQRVYGFYIDTGRIEELVDGCRKASENRPDDAKAWQLLGLVLARRNDDAGAIESLEKAVKLDPADCVAPLYLGEIYIAQGRLKESAETLEIALDRAAKNAANAPNAAASKDLLDIMQTLGRVYERFDDRENSVRIWNRLEELFPNDNDILLRIAETLEEEGKFDEALKRYRNLIEKAGADHSARVRYTLAAADIRIRLGEKQGAIEDFEGLLEQLSADSWQARSIRDQIERIFVRQADYAGLAGYYQKRLKKHPNELETIRRLAIALVRLSRNDEARSLLEETIQKAPSDVRLRLALVDILVAEGDFEPVDRQYAEIDKIEPNNPDYLSQWGLAILENRKIEDSARKAAAVAVWNRILAARPDDPATVVRVAELTNSAGIYDEAEKLYRKAMELRPDEPGYKEYLGFFYHRRDRKAEAVAVLEQIAAGERRNAANLSQLAGIYRGLGYIDQAVTAYRSAVELTPDDFELRMKFASLLAGNDRYDEAEKEYAAAEELVEPASFDCGRLLKALTRFYQMTGKLAAVTETLEKGAKSATDFWRLALYQSALARQKPAVDAIEKAVAAAPESTFILDSAAEIFVRAGELRRAASIYEKLVDADAAGRIEHLKRLANVQRDLGETEKAIETARLVMATGSGSAANTRFYADMLLNVGRLRDGIEALRRAIRIDPSDTTSLSVLAEILYENGQADEALEIFWRLFERTEDLQGRIAATNRMSNYYQQMGRFDQLVEQLRQRGTDPVSRRDVAYCLSQAYVTVADFSAARQTLETLLLGGGEEETQTDDTQLLSQLSSIAEQQGDIATAIRYQEMLCDQRPSVIENERLLSLYQMSGDKSKSIDYLIRTFVEKGELTDQIRAVDSLIAQEDYENAQKILVNIESRHPGDWELLYRRLTLCYWLGDLDGAERAAAELSAMDISRDEKSAKKKDEESQTPPTTSTSRFSRGIRSYSGYSYSPYPGYSPWQLGGQGMHYAVYPGMSSSATWQMVSGQLMQTIFREKLKLEQHYGQQRLAAAEPPKPLFVPDTFGDARFAASVWQLRIAMQRDLNAATDEERTKKKLPMDRLREAVSARRQSLPTSAEDSTALRDRLCWEMFVQAFLQTARQDPESFAETDYALTLLEPAPDEKTDDAGQRTQLREVAAQQVRTELEYRLAMMGENEFRMSAYSTVLRELTLQGEFAGLDKIDIGKEFDDIVARTPVEFLEKHSKHDIEATKKILLQRVEQARSEFEKMRKTDTRTLDDKIDFLLQCWRSADETTGPQGRQSSELQQLLYSYEMLTTALQSLGQEADIEKFQNILDAQAERDTTSQIMAESIRMQRAAWGQQQGLFFRLLRLPQHMTVSRIQMDPAEQRDYQLAVQMLSMLQNVEQLDQKAESFDRYFETFSQSVRRLYRIREEILEKGTTGAGASHYVTQLRSPDSLDHYFSNYLNRIYSPIWVLVQDNQGMTVAVPGMGTPNVPPQFVPLGTDDKKKTVSKIMVDYLNRVEGDSRRLLDLYFELKNDMPETLPQKVPVVSQRRQNTPNLGNLRGYWNQDRVNRYMVDHFLQGDGTQYLTGINPYSRENLLQSAEMFAKRVDAYLATVTPGPEVEADAAKPDFLNRFEKYLNGREAECSPRTKEIIASYRKAAEEQAKQMSASATMNQSLSRKDVDELIARIKMSTKFDEEDGKKANPNHLLLLALLYRRTGETEAAIRTLDSVVLVRAADYRLREQLIIEWYAQRKDDATLKTRAETAVERIMGYQLTGEEMQSLRYALARIGYKNEAALLRDRLLLTATDLNVQLGLLNSLRDDKTPESNEKSVQYALKIFRSPVIQNAAGLRRRETARQLRDRVLEVLKKEGKLGEIVEQVESQWKSAPDSIELMTALADVYNKAGRSDDAKRIAAMIGEKLPDDAGKMEMHANLLQNLKLDADSVEWLKKAAEKDPKHLLENINDYVSAFEKAKQVPKLIEILNVVKPEQLASAFNGLSYRIDNWLGKPEYEEATTKLLQRIWQMDGVDEKVRQTYRAAMSQAFVGLTTRPVYYPIYKDVIFESITPGKAKISRSRGHIGALPSVVLLPDGLSAMAWGGLIPKYLDHVRLLEKYSEAANEIRKLVKEHEAIEEANRNADQYALARLILAFLELRLDNVDEAIRLYEFLGDFSRSANIGNQVTPLTAQEFSKPEDPRTIAIAVKLYEDFLRRPENQYQRDNVMLPLLRLYFRSDPETAEKARKLAIRQLSQSFETLKTVTEKGGNLQIGNRYYSEYQLYPLITQLTRLLLDNGCAFELNLIYNTRFNGQSWTLVGRRNNSSYYNQLDLLVKEIARKNDQNDFASKLELLIPQAESTDGESESLVTSLPLPLGQYILLFEPPRYNPYRKVLFASDLLGLFGDWPRPAGEPMDLTPPRKSLAGIHFGDALISVSKTNPERFAALKKSLEALESASPDEPTLVLSLALCRMLVGEHEAAEKTLQRCLRWAESNRAEWDRIDTALTEKFSTVNRDIMTDVEDTPETENFDAVYFGLWTVLKTLLADAKQMSRPESQTLCKELFVAVSKYVERLYAAERPEPNYHYNRNLFRFSRLNTMLLEFKAHVPAEWWTEFVDACDFHIMEKVFFTSKGQMMDRIRYFRADYADHFSEAMALGATRPVMRAFERLFRDRWPLERSGKPVPRETSFRLLSILNRCLWVARKAEADPDIVFESLLEIVLAKEDGKPPFLGVYSYLGGENGFYRSPMIDLVQWSAAAGRVDDLKKRIAEKRVQKYPPYFEEGLHVSLDAVEFALALQTGDRERSSALEKVFREDTMANDKLRALYAMMVVVSFIKPYEDSPIDEERYVELSELLHACIYKVLKADRYKRFGYYAIRSFYDRLEEDSKKDGNLMRRLEWMERYRSIAEYKNMDGFWFVREERLYREGVRAMENGKLADALAVLRYFGSYDRKRYRYRNLTEYIEKLQQKLEMESPGDRKKLLGKTNLGKIAKVGEVERPKAEPMDVLQNNNVTGLPDLPRGPIVYVNDFEIATGPFWSVDRRDTLPKLDRTYFGDFCRETVQLRLPKLPEHRFLRIRFDLLMLNGIDGLNGQAANYGVDVWGMKLDNGRRPIVTSFSNSPHSNGMQSFPDDYPGEFGFRPSWYAKVEASEFPGEPEKGYCRAQTGATSANTVGFERDAVYSIDLIVPHDATSLTLDFFTKFQDDPYDAPQLNTSFGESWGLDNFQIMLLDKPLALDEEQLKTCLDALLGDDPVRSAAARWRLVAAENAAVQFLSKWFEADEKAKPCLRTEGSFEFFRLDRLLQLIGTPDAESLRQEIRKFRGGVRDEL